jgi:hypothetical protein
MKKFLTIAMMFLMTFAFSTTVNAAKQVNEGEEVTLSSGKTVTVTKDADTGAFYYKFTIKDTSTVNIQLSCSEKDTLNDCSLLDSNKKEISSGLFGLEEGNNQFLLTKGTYFVSVSLWSVSGMDSDDINYIDVTAKLKVKKYKASNMGGTKKSKSKKLALNKKSTIVGKAFNLYSNTNTLGDVCHYYKVTLKKAQKLKVVVDSASTSRETTFRITGNGIKQKDYVGAEFKKAKGKNTTLVITDKKGKAKTLKPGTYTFCVYCTCQNDCVSFKLK